MRRLIWVLAGCTCHFVGFVMLRLRSPYFMLKEAHLSRLMTKATKWHVRPAKTQISLEIDPVWSESLLGLHPFCWFCHEAARLVKSNRRPTCQTGLGKQFWPRSDWRRSEQGWHCLSFCLHLLDSLLYMVNPYCSYLRIIGTIFCVSEFFCFFFFMAYSPNKAEMKYICGSGILLTIYLLVRDQWFLSEPTNYLFSRSSKPTAFYIQSKQMIYKASTGTERTS